MGVKKKPTINLDMMYDGVKAQARMVHDAYVEYGKALQDYYGWMFIDPSDGSLNVSEDIGRKVNDNFTEAQRQHKKFYELFDEYKRLKSEQCGEKRTDYTVFTVNPPKGIETPLKGDATVFHKNSKNNSNAI